MTFVQRSYRINICHSHKAKIMNKDCHISEGAVIGLWYPGKLILKKENKWMSYFDKHYRRTWSTIYWFCGWLVAGSSPFGKLAGIR